MAGTQGFRWTGIDAAGKRTSGIIPANDPKEAQQMLRQMGVEVITLTAKSGKAKRGKKIKPRDVQLFTRFLSTMLASGLPIMQALEIIGNDQENKAMAALIMTIRSEVASGKTLAETFAQYPQQFSTLYSSLIKAGEKSGTLDKILARLAIYMEKIENLRRKIRKALIYPIAILSVAVIVSLVLLVFVVPQFQKMFSTFGADLPFFTQLIVTMSNFIRSYWWILLGVIIVGVFALRKFLQTSEAAQRFKDKYVLKLYLLGPVLQKSIIARFARTLATTMDAGMPIVESMKSMVPIMGNFIYAKAVVKISDEVTSGHTLSAAMQNTGLFPNMVIQMVSIGEASGKLSDMLNKIADYYEEEVNSVVDNLSSLLEPLIMLVLGVVIGGFVIAMYLPIFRIGSLF